MAKFQAERVEYNGKTYTRYVDHPNPRNRDYFRRHVWAKCKLEIVYLHRQVWEDHFGPIPEGYVIHHKDENSLNNTIDNLQMMTASEHGILHRKTDSDNLKQERDARMERIKHLGCEKLKDPEVEERRKRGCLKYWEEKTPITYTCLECGSRFTSKSNRAKYCSRKCTFTFLNRRRRKK